MARPKKVEKQRTIERVSEPIQKFQVFCASKHTGIVLQALIMLQNRPETFKEKNHFDTLYKVAMTDGETALIEKFKNLINASLSSDIDTLNILNGTN